MEQNRWILDSYSLRVHKHVPRCTSTRVLFVSSQSTSAVLRAHRKTRLQARALEGEGLEQSRAGTL